MTGLLSARGKGATESAQHADPILPKKKKLSRTYLKNVRPFSHVSSFSDTIAAQKAIEKTLGGVKSRQKEVAAKKEKAPALDTPKRRATSPPASFITDRGSFRQWSRSRSRSVCSAPRSRSAEVQKKFREPSEEEVLRANGFMPLPTLEEVQVLDADNRRATVGVAYLVTRMPRDAAYGVMANGRKYQHPNLQVCRHGWYAGDETFIAYDWCDGWTAEALVKGGLAICREAGISILKGVLKSLRYLNSQGVCHGGLSLSTVFLMSDLRVTVGGLSSIVPHTAEVAQRDHDSLRGMLEVILPSDEELRTALAEHGTAAALLAASPFASHAGDTPLRPLVVAVHHAIKTCTGRTYVETLRQ